MSLACMKLNVDCSLKCELQIYQLKSTDWGGHQLKLSFVAGNAFKMPESFELKHTVHSCSHIRSRILLDRYLVMLLDNVRFIWRSKQQINCTQNVSGALFSLKSIVKSSLISMGDGSGPAFSFFFFSPLSPEHHYFLIMSLQGTIQASGK